MRKSLIAAAVILFLGVIATETYAGGPGGCPPWRPCGPGNSWGGNRLLHQGAFGADFRPACATHDACLASGRPRWQCDQEFYGNMLNSCNCSRHPVLCQMRAFRYYAGARLFGGLYY